MKAGKWVLGAFLTVNVVTAYGFGVEDAAQGIAERAARKAATGVARDAVNTVFDDADRDKDKKKQGSRTKKKSKPARTKSKTQNLNDSND